MNTSTNVDRTYGMLQDEQAQQGHDHNSGK